MKQAELVASYLPSLVVSFLCNNDTPTLAPMRQSFSTVCMFADVSGFTALSEKMARYGPEGAEYLAKHLNSYFSQMVKIIASMGGDIFKFAGDAMLVLWPDDPDMPLEERVQRAGQCALEIQSNLHKAELRDGVTLSVKIGIGVGEVSVLHIGGILRRMEYIAVGEPLVQAFGAEHHAEAGGDVILSPRAWALASSCFKPVQFMDDGAAQIAKDGKGECLQPKKKISILKMLRGARLDEAGEEVERRLRNYVAGAILPWINPDSLEQEVWGSDLRNVTVLFVNLGLKDMDMLAASKYDDAMGKMHDVLRAVQGAVYQYEGAVNKCLNDDKGSTLIAVFGLPPLSHEDDATRGVLCGLAICERLWSLGLVASVGITTGVVFCGVVGSTTRKEYTILGDTVNLSARLMQRAGQVGGGVLCDLQIRRAASQGLAFQELDTITVKGKSMPVRVFRPYPAGLMRFLPPRSAPGSEPSYLRMAFEAQLVGFRVHRLLRPLELPPPIPGDGVKDPGETEAANSASSAATNVMVPGSTSGRGSNTSTRRGTQFWAAGAPKTPSAGAVTSSSGSFSSFIPRDHALTIEEVFGTAHVAASSGSNDGDAAVDDDGWPVADMYTMNRKVKDALTASTGALSAKLRTVNPPLGGGAYSRKRGSGEAARRGSGNSHLTRPDIPLAKMRSLLLKNPAGLSVSNAAFRGVPCVRSLTVTVPKGFEIEEALDVRVSYDSRDCITLPQLVPVEVEEMIDDAGSETKEDKVKSLAAYRDRAVAVAKSTGHVHASIPNDEFLLKIHGSDAIIPVSYELQAIWLWQFVAESGAVAVEDVFNPGESLKVKIVRCRDVNVVQTRQARAMQVLIESKMMLVALKRGSTAVLEGEFGLGKTALLARFVGDIMSGTTSVFCSAGSPFTRSQPYAAWADVLQQFLKELRDAKGLASSTDAVAEILRSMPPPSKLAEYAGLLNPVLGLELPALPEGTEEALKGGRKDKLLRGLLFHLIKAMCTEVPAVVVIDDGLYLHKSSWDLLRDVATACALPPGSAGSLSLMLVVATRPIEHYLDVVAPSAPASFKQLVDSPHVNTLRLARVPQSEVITILAAAARWGGLVSQDVITLIEGKTHGNPAMIQEVVLSLIARGRLTHSELPPGGVPGSTSAAASNLSRLIALLSRGSSPMTAKPSAEIKGLAALQGTSSTTSFRDLLSAGAVAGLPQSPKSPRGARSMQLGSIGEDVESHESDATESTLSKDGSASIKAMEALMISQAAIAAGAGLARIGVGWLSIAGPLGPVAGIVARKGHILGVDSATGLPTAVLTLTDGLAATHVPYCRRSHWSLSTRVDRLSIMEQLVLKVGSLIGKQMRNTLAAVNMAGASTSPMNFLPHTAADSTAANRLSLARTGATRRRMTVGSGGKAAAVAMASTAGSPSGADRFTITFRFNILVECFPLEILRDPGEMATLCVALEKMGFLTHGYVKGAPNLGNFAEAVFTINSGFLPDTVRFRMLAEQRKGVEKKVKDCIERYEEQLRKNIMSKMLTAMAATGDSSARGDGSGSGAASVMMQQRSAWMKVRKNPETATTFSFFTRGTAKKEWKTRWLVLSHDTLCMYKEAESPTSGGRPVQMIWLEGATASLMTGTNLVSTLGEEFVIKLDSSKWEKKGKASSAIRSFYIAAEGRADAEDWLLWLKSTIGYLNERRTRKPSTHMDAGIAVSQPAPGVGAAASEALSPEDSSPKPADSSKQAEELMRLFAPSPTGALLVGDRLVVSVEEAQRLVPAKPSGTPMVFVTLALDDVVVRTLPTHGSLDPIWDSVLGFHVNAQQAAEGVVRVYVWDRDKEGADHLMGWANLDVARLPISVETHFPDLSDTAVKDAFIASQLTAQNAGQSVVLHLSAINGIAPLSESAQDFGTLRNTAKTLPSAGLVTLRARLVLTPTTAETCRLLRTQSDASAKVAASDSVTPPFATSVEWHTPRRASNSSLPMCEEKYEWLNEVRKAASPPSTSPVPATDRALRTPSSQSGTPASKTQLRPIKTDFSEETSMPPTPNGVAPPGPPKIGDDQSPEHAPRSTTNVRRPSTSLAMLRSPLVLRRPSLQYGADFLQQGSLDRRGSVNSTALSSRRTSMASDVDLHTLLSPSNLAMEPQLLSDSLLSIIQFLRGDAEPREDTGHVEDKKLQRFQSMPALKRRQSSGRAGLMRTASGDHFLKEKVSETASRISESMNFLDGIPDVIEEGSPTHAHKDASLPTKKTNAVHEEDMLLTSNELAEICAVLAKVAGSLRSGLVTTSKLADSSASMAVAAMKVMEVDEQNQKWLTTEYMKPTVDAAAPLASPSASVQQSRRGSKSFSPVPLAPQPEASAEPKPSNAPSGTPDTKTISPVAVKAQNSPAHASPAPPSTPAVPSTATAAPPLPSILASVADNHISISAVERTLQLPGDLIAGPGCGTCSAGFLGWGLNHLGVLGEQADEVTTAAAEGDNGLLSDESIYLVSVSEAQLRERQLKFDPHDRVYYEDAEDNMHGPFPAYQLADWLQAGDLPADAAVRLGGPSSEQVALGSVAPALELRGLLWKAKDLALGSGDISAWDFDVFKTGIVDPIELIPIPVAIALRLRLPRFFPISESNFLSFVRDVCGRMSLYGAATPYHNFFHAVDVMQCANVILTSMNAARIFTPVETLAFSLGALCHDLEHPGYNNLYLINSHDELAIRYNDQSVLENHHAATAFQLIRSNSLLAGLSRQQYKEVRKVMIAIILATDMTCHFALTDELKAVGLANATRLRYALNRKPTFSSFGSTFSTDAGVDGGALLHSDISTASPDELADISAGDRLVMLKNFLHAADISNPTKPWALCKKWSDLVLQEFFQQGDREKQEGLPISPNTDRHTVKQAQMSMNFIDFVVAPLYIAIATLLPGAQHCVERLNENRKKWSDLLTGEIEGAADASQSQKEVEKKKWARRNTAFTEVMMPLVQEAACDDANPKESVETARALSLRALETFANAATGNMSSRRPSLSSVDNELPHILPALASPSAPTEDADAALSRRSTTPRPPSLPRPKSMSPQQLPLLP